jgi:hypothetical protein
MDLANPVGRRGRAPLVNVPLSLAALQQYKRGGVAIATTNRLFFAHGERRQDPAWQSPNGEKYSRYKQRAAVSTLSRLQTQLIHHITERIAELELLHRRLGQHAAHMFLAGIKQRSKALDNLVKDYNALARDAGVRALDAGRLREHGLDNEEMWDIDLLMARGDWAVYGFVRAGIEARARLDHVVEEKDQLRLHAKRMVYWVDRRLPVLLEALGSDDSTMMDHDLKRIIIHHYRVIKSLLNADAPLLMLADRALLLTLKRRIEDTLDLERMALVVDRDDDADSVVSEEDGIDPEFHDEQLGGFIAEQLQGDDGGETAEGEAEGNADPIRGGDLVDGDLVDGDRVDMDTPPAPPAPSSLPEPSLCLPLAPPGPVLDAAKLTRSLAHLSDSDIECVASPEKMLNDEGINSYLSLLTLHFATDKAVHLSTFFWTSYARHGYNGVKKWLPECWSADHTPGILLISINQNLHWFLISVDFAGRQISLYDSMTDHSHIASQAFKVKTTHKMSNSSLIVIFRI